MPRYPSKREKIRSRPEYKVWDAMIQRCVNPNANGYAWYGGRGIKVCERWIYFLYFYEDMGPRPANDAQIDRIDNNGNYEPGNCRWVTRKQNMRNTRSNHLLTYNGRTQPLTAWAEEVGLSYTTVLGRVRAGWSVADALLRPKQRGRKVGQRKDARMLTYNGKTQSVRDWERAYGLRRDLLHQRLGLGWDLARALTTPKEPRKKRH